MTKLQNNLNLEGEINRHVTATFNSFLLLNINHWAIEPRLGTDDPNAPLLPLWYVFQLFGSLISSRNNIFWVDSEEWGEMS